MRCVFCGRKGDGAHERCPNPACGAERSYAPDEQEERRAVRRERKRLETGPRLASEVNDPEPRRLKVGAPWDEVLGGGVVEGGTVLLYGGPGTGKTTNVSRLAESIAHKAGKLALYATAEQRERELKSVATRTGKPFERLKLWTVDEIERVTAEAARESYAAIVVDSLQRFWAIGERPGSEAAIREIIRQTFGMAQTGAVVLVISQVNKEGLPAGPQGAIHDVDAVVLLENRDGELWAACPEKNRHGKTPAEAFFPKAPPLRRVK